MPQNQDDQERNSYLEQDTETEVRGQKGGTSQKDYRESSEMEHERDPAERDDEMGEEISGW